MKKPTKQFEDKSDRKFEPWLLECSKYISVETGYKNENQRIFQIEHFKFNYAQYNKIEYILFVVFWLNSDF